MDILMQRSATLLDKCRKLRDGGKRVTWPERDKSGQPRASIENFQAFLEFAEVTVVFDEFERRALLEGIPDIRECDDAAITTLRGTADFFGLKLTAEFTDHAVQFLSGQHRVHPVRRYIDGLEWDGTGRIDTWLRDFRRRR